MQFGPYTLKQRLGAGGMGEVFLASQALSKGVSRRVVVKRILPHLSQDSRFAETFVHEAALLAQLNHPNIATLYDFGEVQAQLYLAIEYLEGLDLSAVLDAIAEPVPLPIALRVTHDVALGLHHAHEARGDDGQPLLVVHRDVTPSNIFLTKAGRTKVLDFGVAKTNLSSKQTTTGVLKGKSGFFAPEQVKLEAIDRRVDVFALGVVLYEMVTRHHPFRRDGEFQTLTAIVNEEAQAPSALGGPVALDGLLARAMAKDASARFATMTDFAAAVAAVGPLATDAEVARFLADTPALSARLSAPVPEATPVPVSDGTVSAVHTPRLSRAPIAVAAESAPVPASGGTVSTARAPRRSRAPLAVAAAFAVVMVGSLAAMRGDPLPPEPVAAAPTLPTTLPTTLPVVVAPAVKDPAPDVAAVPKTGRLKIVLPDWPATLYVDGKEIDDGPPWREKDGYTLATGRHDVRLVNTTMKIEARRAVMIPGGKTRTLEVRRAEATSY